MGANLKRRSAERDTMETKRAVDRISSDLGKFSRSITSTVDNIKSFDYTVVEVTGTGDNPVSVPVTGTEAVLSGSSADTSNLWWQITGGNLEVTYLVAGRVARFLVF